MNHNSLLKRFCDYVKIDTQADENSKTYPSTKGQLELGKMLVKELHEIGIKDAYQTEYGLVFGTIPNNAGRSIPTIAWVAHMDTSPETSGKNVSPVIHENYDGKDIILPKDKTKIITTNENHDLPPLKGKTIITTDGTTLLGADNKAGVAVIMQAAQELIKNNSIIHGDIRICFTCDEEIGKGVNHLDLKELGAIAAYTLDGGGQGEIDGETFSADLATVTIHGRNIHPSIAKNRMTNAIRLAAIFIERLPTKKLAPETTEGMEGFLHPYTIAGGVAEVTIKILLRDFNSKKLREYEAFLSQLASHIQLEYAEAKFDILVTKQYRNMADGMSKESRAIPFAVEAMKLAGLQPKVTSVRGGTDGSRMTEIGLPTPNLSTGEHNPHSPLEWTCLEEMEKAVEVLLHLAQVWAKP